MERNVLFHKALCDSCMVAVGFYIKRMSKTKTNKSWGFQFNKSDALSIFSTPDIYMDILILSLICSMMRVHFHQLNRRRREKYTQTDSCLVGGDIFLKNVNIITQNKRSCRRWENTSGENATCLVPYYGNHRFCQRLMLTTRVHFSSFTFSSYVLFLSAFFLAGTNDVSTLVMECNEKRLKVKVT